jgi:putative hemolysin
VPPTPAVTGISPNAHLIVIFPMNNFPVHSARQQQRTTNMKTHIEESVGDRVLARAQNHGAYTLSLARTNEEIRAAQTLRFIVFNLELNEGLEHSYATCLDADHFDEICDHLLVKEAATGEVVGTYRLQTGAKAAQNRGYYSAQEFDFSPFEPIRAELVELGRACVHVQHRNLAVLSLLWSGISLYCRQRDCRYLIGCSSLTSQDAAVGAAAYSDMCRKHLVEARFQTKPTEAYRCSMEVMSRERVKIPKLLSAYLSLGAKICGAPAIDREFKTIDFLTFMDLASLPARTVQRYLSGPVDKL